jgi:antitoxin Phd
MKVTWQLQEAKNRLSEVVDTAVKKGPQTITRHGRPTVVVLSVEEYARLNPKSQRSIVDWLRDCPGPELADLIEDRPKDKVRDIDLE